MNDLKMLFDERDVKALAIRYANTLDERNWDAFASCFSDDVAIDASGLRGVPPSTMGRDAWVARVRSSAELFDVTLHYITNQEVSLSGDEASCLSYLYAQHLTRNEESDDVRFVVHGAYTHSMRRGPDGWRICGVAVDFRIRDGEIGAPKTLTT